ncbi:3,4-dihydroxy-2-butanone 4-phosphate synthase [Porphyromonas levii]|uniref:3,4-dihydroxy-2-butanone 4-phosphate synthase n=1 Tax=Porphyromonas levii TaxID=28114 RepID=A0A4Y8WPD4_9PORP|nr:3,4-dihydroxy-2-butanone-4-phosphate synthase [Porphyromonas levii]MBR8703552.1 3,4-dihydroxy-2-butanone 4-phosphate synthase [Porphyromonas levii]MBR8712693.1 3,4-dihydroxy-2-butanone 4-phosphate synthase [Porphyromonas levii]MBR8714693.1 3,4-dihydroxy-2-butanone 4-phosphate synthase [Porphyromonas levii]MBR8727177.1 3,4-dihydroxy-2-butanone 4-phosphate synthase [Porphyromonas levii]MBR8729552.1 3,4-dihydroxy-2-butanone 4-phosphate synthase [Porphyromonas levii]
MKQSETLPTVVANRIEAAIEALRDGRGILLVDDEDRENEGDIIYPTSNLTPQNIALMIRECSGIICLCLKTKKCLELQLPQMVPNNTCVNRTAFTISIEAKEGVTTGVSAKDRCHTIRTAARAEARPEDLVHPGHVFPLQAKEGGVMERRGHTEGSIDIVSIAGLGDSAVLCELTNPDGTMARMPEIKKFAEAHNMPVLTIEDIVCYRTIHG